MKMAAIILTALWVFGLFPIMLLGALWSGSFPLWPPVRSTSLIDNIDWVGMFVAGYGLPVVVPILFLLNRRKVTR